MGSSQRSKENTRQHSEAARKTLYGKHRRKDAQATHRDDRRKDAQAQPTRNTYVRKEKAAQVRNRNIRKKERASSNRKGTRGGDKEAMF
jgi:hypothetical protein